MPELGRASAVEPSEVFLSYASADRERVAALVHALEASGMHVWWDRDIGYGESFHKVIEQALSAARCVVVVWTQSSVASEWVVNEASDARKRNRLVPVLLDAVSPPLEFRHLQAADLSSWRGDPADPQFASLQRALAALLDHPVSQAAAPRRAWPQPAQLLGVGGLLIGVSVLLLTLKYVGLIHAEPAVGSAPAALADAPEQKPALSGKSETPSVAAHPTERVDLFDPERGAKLIAANTEAWREAFDARESVATVGVRSWVVVDLAGEEPVRFDTLTAFVNYTNDTNVKELDILTSDRRDGPWETAARITVPNYRNMEQPSHELRFEPVEARFVRLQVVSNWRDNKVILTAYVGSLHLYASED